jgi:hypothetical protein
MIKRKYPRKMYEESLVLQSVPKLSNIISLSTSSVLSQTKPKKRVNNSNCINVNKRRGR